LIGSGTSLDLQQAVQWYRRGGDNALAQYHLGVCYRDGKGVTQDYKEAFQFFAKAATQGHNLSMCSLASLYFSGMYMCLAYHTYLLVNDNGDTACVLPNRSRYSGR
jgi:TPR repeat protein